VFLWSWTRIPTHSVAILNRFLKWSCARKQKDCLQSYFKGMLKNVITFNSHKKVTFPPVESYKIVNSMQRQSFNFSLARILSFRIKYIFFFRYTYDYSCFLVPRPTPMGGLTSFVLPFDPLTWSFSLLSMIIMLLFYGIFFKVNYFMTMTKKKFANFWTFVFAVPFEVSDPRMQLFKISSFR